MKNSRRRPTTTKSSSPERRSALRLSRPLILALMLGVSLAAIGAAIFPDSIKQAFVALAQQQRQQTDDRAGKGSVEAQGADDVTDAELQQPISESALRQIAALAAEKQARSPVERKIDSQLLYASRMERGEPAAPGVQMQAIPLGADEQGEIEIDVSARVDQSLLDYFSANNIEVITSFPDYHTARVKVALSELEGIAALPQVNFLMPKQEAIVWSKDERQQQQRRESGGNVVINGAGITRQTPTNGRPSFAERAARVRANLSRTLASLDEDSAGGNGAMTNTGRVNSEGDTTHKANRARAAFNVNGTGVKIGILSDGAINYRQAQASGDLPPDVTILPGQAGTGDEGTAMMEIVHDLAPGAKLFHATAFVGGPAGFAINIRALRDAGCDIIIDDVFYFAETPFQDGQAPNVKSPTNGGVIAQAVNDVTATGVSYFSSAGNSGNKTDNTSGVWEGDFVDGGAGTGPLLNQGNVHNFGGGQNFNPVTAMGSGVYNLFWADPLGASANDYDLYALNAAGTAISAASTNVQDGTQDPYEQFAPSAVNTRLVIVKFAGAGRYLHLNTNRGRLLINTPGQTHGHSSSALAYSVAATPSGPVVFGAGPTGPFPNPFNSTNQTETFSSDGPRRLFFNADSTPITPGNFSANGGLLRQKPDITAADGTSVTGVGGFGSPFFGTSAAAPHAGAIAGLIKSARPDFTQAQIRSVLTSTAIDIETPGVDRDTGAGIVMALESLQTLNLQGGAGLELGAVTPTEAAGGNGNGFIEPGERGNLSVQLRNAGLAPATGVTATLTTTTPGVTITPPGTSAYPDIPANNGTATNTTPFEFAISSSAACPSTVNFTLTVNYAGGQRTQQVFNFSVTIAQSVSISSTLDATPPTNGAGYTATTGFQTGRLVRNGVASTCGAFKPNTGINAGDATVQRRYDAYTFQNTTPNTLCVTVTLTNGNVSGTPQIFSAAYAPTFNPASPDFGSIGDAGASPVPTNSYSFDVPANTNFVVVVNEITNPPSGATASIPYTLNVSGLPCTAAPANQPPVNTVPGAQTTSENAALVFSTAGGNRISVNDPEAGNLPVRVTLSVTNGTLTLSRTNGLTFSAGDGTDDATMTFTGSLADINTALDGLAFRPTAGFTGSATLTITTDDQGFVGSGGAKSDTDTVTINVTEGGNIQFSASAYSVNEAAGTATITVTRTGGSAGAATVNYATSNGTATAGADYTATNGTLTFAAGETSKTFTIAITNDTTDELNETVNITLSQVTGSGALGTPATAVLTILDDDAPVTASVNDITIAEGNSGNAVAIFTVTLSAPSEQMVTVNYATADITARAGSDYVATSGTVTFNPGETSKTVNVLIISDTVNEPNETFSLFLFTPANATIARDQGIATITNDDSSVQLSQASYTVAEGAGSITFTVTRTGTDTSQTTTVDFQTDDSGALIRCDTFNGTAYERCDYSSQSQRLTFAPGETTKTVTVFINDDAFAEGTETFTVSLRNVSANSQLGTQATATVTITDNDTTTATTNPIDTPSFFVRQLYVDFLNREPDTAGFNAFVARLNGCAANDTTCDRIAVALAFSRSDEYLLNKGYFSFRFYRAAFGRRQTYDDFVRDINRLTVATGPEVEPRRAQFAVEFTQRSEFITRYGALNNQQYVQQLYQTAGVTITPAEQAQIVAQLDSNQKTRAQVLRDLVERQSFFNREYNAGFVATQYFGFLRRDADEGGFQNFLNIANASSDANGVVTDAGARTVVANFINSIEYRLRFGRQ